jgi:Fe(3+) dicitrate transport protein
MTRPTALLLLGLLVLAAPAPGKAEPTRSALSGRVLDSSGAVLPGATVTVRRPESAFVRTAAADTEGHFGFGDLSAGTYTVTAAAEGFSIASRTVPLPTGESREVELTLQPGTFTEHVTIIASRLAATPEAVQRIPGSVDVVDQATLEASHVFNFSEALRKVPGLNVRDEEGFGLRPNIGVRGESPTRSTRVLLLEDGVFVTYAPYGDNASYYHPPVERYESIEVLKGAGQVAYGPVTVGAVVNYITPAPPLKPSGSLSLSGGNRGFFNGRGQAGGTWGRVALRGEYTHKRGDGSRDNVSSRLDDLNLKAQVELSPRQMLTFKSSWYGEDSNVTYSGLRADEYLANPRGNVFKNDHFYGDRTGAAARHSWQIGASAVLTTQLYGSRFSRDWWRQSSNSGQRPNDSADPRCGGLANLDTTCGNEGRLRDYWHGGVEPRLRFGHGLLGVRSETEIGLRAHFENQDRIQKNGDSPTARDGVVVESNLRENQAYSAFVQNRFLLGRFTVTPGIRAEHIRYDRTNRLANGGLGVNGRTQVTEWVPGLGAAFSPRAAFTAFAGVHRGFAPPRTEDIINNTTGGVVELNPEESWTYEMGFRSLPRSGVGFDATAFRIDYENQVIPASVAGGVGTTLTNGGQTLHQGLELSGRLDLGTLIGRQSNPYVKMALTWLPTARFEGRRLSTVSGFTTVSVSGNRLPYAPRLMLDASLGYSSGSGLEGFVELVRVGEQFGDDLNTREGTADGQRGLLPAYTILNATVNYRVPALHSTLFVTAKNLTDELYVVDRIRGLLPGPSRLLQAGVSITF